MTEITPSYLTLVLARVHNKRRKEEERVTLVVAVVTAEFPTCTINRVSCDMLPQGSRTEQSDDAILSEIG